MPGAVTVIPLGARLPAPSSNLPGRHGPGRPPSLLGLAPDGVCRACRVAAASGGLLPHRFTLTTHDVAVCFLWRCPRVAPPGCCPASCPAEPGLSSPGRAHAPARSDGLSGSRARPIFGKARPPPFSAVFIRRQPLPGPRRARHPRRAPRQGRQPWAWPPRNARTRRSGAGSWGSSGSVGRAGGR